MHLSVGSLSMARGMLSPTLLNDQAVLAVVGAARPLQKPWQGQSLIQSKVVQLCLHIIRIEIIYRIQDMLFNEHRTSNKIVIISTAA